MFCISMRPRDCGCVNWDVCARVSRKEWRREKGKTDDDKENIIKEMSREMISETEERIRKPSVNRLGKLCLFVCISDVSTQKDGEIWGKDDEGGGG
jgi:hypothetical protein